jgi:hypothetical protein
MSRSAITQEQGRLIAAMKRDGMTDKEIGAVLGRSKSAIKNYRFRQGILVREAYERIVRPAPDPELAAQPPGDPWQNVRFTDHPRASSWEPMFRGNRPDRMSLTGSTGARCAGL